MSYASQVKYSRLSDLDEDDGSTVLEINNMDKESTFQFESVFSYNEDAKSKKYGSTRKNQFGSAFQYTNMTVGPQAGHLGTGDHLAREYEASKPSSILVFTSWFLTFLSYLFFALTIPITYWIFVKKLGEFDRLVVFRLGKMIGVKGPGRVLIFPWMDRTKKIDVRAAAFAVPPQQFITCDGGIVEMGAEIQYGIVDVITMVSEVADHQDILRSLSKTLLVKHLVKKTVRQVEKERRRQATEIQDELNLQVRKWGIDVQKVELSDPKILKQPENSSSTAVGSILKGLGMKSDPQYPTPEEFVRTTAGLDEDANKKNDANNPFAGIGAMGAPGGGGGGAPAIGGPPGANVNMSLLQMMTSNMAKQANSGMPGIIPPSESTGPANICNWGKCLDVILQSEFNGPIDDDASGLYKLEITETENGKDIYFITLSADVKLVQSGNETGGVCPDGRNPDVTVTISSSDLAAVLEGTLAPLQAYLTGRISASGDVRKLMFFDKLSKRGHKPGTMFNV